MGHPEQLRSVALLIFLSRPARAGIIPPHFFLSAHDLLHGLHVSRTGHSCLFEFTALAPHKSFFQFVGGRRDQARRTPSVTIPTALRRNSRLWPLPTRRTWRRTTRTRIRRPLQDLHQVQIPHC